MAYTYAQRYDAAIAEFEKTAQLEKPGYSLLVDWGLVYDVMNRPEDALAKLRQAAALEPTGHIYSQIGMVYAKRQRWPEALEALGIAEKADPRWAPTYNYRAKIYFAQNNIPGAIENYRRALELDPTLADARDEVARAEAMLLRK
jgi:tetratricopeptide (TPR) repeat protein